MSVIETPTNYHIDTFEIERQARQLRAEALSALFAGLVQRLRATLHRSPASATV